MKLKQIDFWRKGWADTFSFYSHFIAQQQQQQQQIRYAAHLCTLCFIYSQEEMRKKNINRSYEKNINLNKFTILCNRVQYHIEINFTIQISENTARGEMRVMQYILTISISEQKTQKMFIVQRFFSFRIFNLPTVHISFLH